MHAKITGIFFEANGHGTIFVREIIFSLISAALESLSIIESKTQNLTKTDANLYRELKKHLLLFTHFLQLANQVSNK